jgi:hypothetical protein
MSNPKDTAGTFVPCQPPQVVRVRSLGNQPALLIGWWVDRNDTTLKAEVVTFSSPRDPADVEPWSGPPGVPTKLAPGFCSTTTGARAVLKDRING